MVPSCLKTHAQQHLKPSSSYDIGNERPMKLIAESQTNYGCLAKLAASFVRIYKTWCNLLKPNANSGE